MSNVTRLSLAPVKGTRLHSVEEIQLEHSGACGDRRFFVIDGRDRMVNGKQLGALQTVVADHIDGRLRLSFPYGAVVDSEIALGAEVEARFYSRSVVGRVLEGPWSAALSEHVGQAVRILEPIAGSAVDRGAAGAATLISEASLRRLASAAGQPEVDARRFRMLVEVDGLDAHAEDGWVSRTARIGEAAVRWGGHVGRCLITSRDPDSGEIDLPTLDILGSYRRDAPTTAPLAFGIYGQVLQEGAVRVGDPVLLS